MWIWAAGADLPSHVFFRKDVDLPGGFRAAKFSITCDDAYTLFVNGKIVARNASWYTMQDLDLAPFLRRGRNVIAVDARNFQSEAGLLAEGAIATSSGAIDLKTDRSWRASTTAPAGWKTPGFDDSGWPEAREEGPLGMAPWRLPTHDQQILNRMLGLKPCRPAAASRPDRYSPDSAEGFRWPKVQTQIDRSFQRLNVAPVSMSGHPALSKPGTLRVDFGRELSGWVEVSVASKEPPLVEIQVGEASPESQFSTTMRREHGRFVYRLIPTGGFTGFRYAWIKFASVPKPVTSVVPRAVWRIYPANYEGSFHCSDPTLDRVWAMGAYTVRLNLDPHALGAILRPERGDRFPWMGDDRVAHQALFSAFGDYGLAREDLEGFVKPADRQVVVNGIPGYTLDWIVGLYDYWMASGDRVELERYLPTTLDILRELAGPKTPAGWLFTDWEPGLQATTPETLLAFRFKYVQAAAVAKAMAAGLRESGLVSEFEKLRRDELAVIGADPTHPGPHATTNGILGGAIASPYPKTFPAATATPYFTYYVLEALSRSNQNQRALGAIRLIWGGMLKHGATTTWEYFPPNWAKALPRGWQTPTNNIPGSFVSLCHPWSAGATAWLSRHVLGVTPLEPGYKRFRVRPFAGDLKWAEGSVPTPRGPIRVRWTRQGKRLSIHVQAPPGTKAVVG